ncbi:MAG: tetratricopeptide repeat protein, partial [Anaerolineales bacterium]
MEPDQPEHESSGQPSGESKSTITTGDVIGSRGIAIGTGARAISIYIASLLDGRGLVELFRRHWPRLVVRGLLQAALIALWSLYADRFLIPWWVLAVAMLLLEAAIISGYASRVRPAQRQLWQWAAVGSILAFLTFAGVTSWQILNPVKFETDTFGVAVAHFGEGSDLQNTARAQEVSAVVLEQLLQRAHASGLKTLEFRPIGLVRTEAEAREDGERIRADLVIWGRLLESDAATTLNFAVLETPDKVSNPAFPRAVPLREEVATGLVVIQGRAPESIAADTTTIAAFTVGLAHYFRWDFVRAGQAFEEALVLASDRQSDEYRYLLHLYYGLSLQWPGRLNEATIQLESASQLRPDDPAAPLAMAFGFRSLGRLDEARAKAKLAFDLCTKPIQDDGDPLAFFDRALANDVLEDLEGALADYRSALQRAPDLYVARIGLIRLLLRQMQWDEALREAGEAIALAEGREANAAWAYLHQAEAYHRKGDVTQAIIAYDRATALAPGVDWIHFQAGRFFAEIGDPAKAEQAYERMIEVTSNKSWGHSTLAELYRQTNRLEAAAVEYREALQFAPNVGGIRVALADVYVGMGQTQKAQTEYARAVADEPDNAYAHAK